MKKKLQPLFFVAIGLFLSFCSHAQLKVPGTGSPDIRDALQKVIDDYPKEFANLKGEVLNNNPQTVEYSSKLSFKSAEQNTITLYSGKQAIYSWQAKMFTHEEFDEAAKKYKSLYNDLKGMTITLNRDYTYNLAGDYARPDESKNFCSTVFALRPNASGLPKVKIELSMQYEFAEWKIYLIVYQKEREDAERGNIEE